MADILVARFHRVFADRLASGKGNPIDVVQAIQALDTGARLVACLDVYCTLFDPARPPKSRASLELCRSTGFNLFGRALELADAANELAEMVCQVAGVAAAPLKDAKLVKRVPLYRVRFAALGDDQHKLRLRAQDKMKTRGQALARQRYLLDDLEKAFRNRHGRAAQGDDLVWFDPGPATARVEFERLAKACAAAWTPRLAPVAGRWWGNQFTETAGARPEARNTLEATQHVHAAFAAFAAFVERQVVQPLDLFRLLVWASEPQNPYLNFKVPNAAKLAEPSQAWSSVWTELYQDIATRGAWMGHKRWNVDRMVHGRGYAGKDLQFVLARLKSPDRELLERRLAASFMAPFAAAQDGRRRAKVWGDMKGFEIVDELDSEAVIKDLIEQFGADPTGVLARKIQLEDRRMGFDGKLSLFQTVHGVFTVVWIPRPHAGAAAGGRRSAAQVAYVEIHEIPGVVFKARGDRVGLGALIEDKVYSDLAANAAALAQFMLAYLQGLGYVLDVITAGASGSVRVVVLRFIEARLNDMVVETGLKLAGIDNPWVQALAGMAAGMVPSRIKTPHKPGHVIGLEEAEHNAQKVTRGGNEFRPTARVADAASSPVPGVTVPVRTLAPATARKLGPRTQIVADTVFVVNEASTAAPKVPGLIEQAKDLVTDVKEATDEFVDMLAPTPALAGHAQTDLQHAAARGVMATGLAPRGMSPGVGGLPARGTQKGTERAGKAAESLRKSADFKLLEIFENKVMSRGERTLSQIAKVKIVQALEKSAGNKAAVKKAMTDLRTQLNEAKKTAGEFNLLADLYTCFDVAELVVVPTRGKGAGVLDVVVRLKQNSELNGGKLFAIGEGKGGLQTGLGKVTGKRYAFKDGAMVFEHTSDERIRQASGEWFYQKFAEMYMMGQKAGTAEGKQLQHLANELFQAARDGKVGVLVGKSNVHFDRKLIDSSEEVARYFASQAWDRSHGFPLPP